MVFNDDQQSKKNKEQKKKNGLPINGWSLFRVAGKRCALFSP